jgi:hypothetical protein
MCAESVAELPVTIPVNITMRLAQKGQRCLLVDLDLERDAIAKVFDAAGDGLRPREEKLEMPTCINNLWVWPARNFNKDDGAPAAIELTEVIAGLKNRYDRLILYAPNMKLLSIWPSAFRRPYYLTDQRTKLRIPSSEILAGFWLLAAA